MFSISVVIFLLHVCFMISTESEYIACHSEQLEARQALACEGYSVVWIYRQQAWQPSRVDIWGDD